MLINSYVLVASLTPQAYKCSNVLVALTSAPKEHTSVFWNWTHIQHSSVAATSAGYVESNSDGYKGLSNRKNTYHPPVNSA